MTRQRVGIAGAGWVAGARHLPSYARLDGVDVVAIYDRTLARAQRLAADAPDAVVATDDLDRFLGHDLDVVSVTTSPWSHAEITTRALASGAHVLTEKPMAMDGAEARQMVDAAKAADRLLCVSHNLLWSRGMRGARAKLGGAVPEYVTGLQLSAETRRLPVWYRNLPGGLMFDEAPHMAYLLNDLLGGSLRLDLARGEFTGARQPRTVELLVAGETGRGQITMVFDAPVSEWHLLASASTGVVDLDLFRDIAVRLAPDGAHGALDIARSSAAALAGHTLGFARSGARLVSGRQLWGHDALIAQFVAAVRRTAPVPVRSQDALAVVDFTDHLLAALDLTGRRHVPDPDR
jgi:scyllo-inositol 2-dehydrogenase (NADP+)